MLSFIFRAIYSIAEINQTRSLFRITERQKSCKIQLNSMHASSCAFSKHKSENIQLRVRLLLHIEKFTDVCAIAQLREQLSPHESVSHLVSHRKRKKDNSKFLKSEIFMTGNQEIVSHNVRFKIISNLSLSLAAFERFSAMESCGSKPLSENRQFSSDARLTRCT